MCAQKQFQVLRQRRLPMSRTWGYVSGGHCSLGKSNSFVSFVVWPKKRFFSKRRNKPFWDVIGDVFVTVVFVSKTPYNGKNCEVLDSDLSSPRSINGCGKAGVWSFIHKKPLTTQKHVKTINTDITPFALAKKPVVTTKGKCHLVFWKKSCAKINQSPLNFYQKT